MNFSFYICDTLGYLQVGSLIRTLLNILRFVVPLILIVMIVMDLVKNTFNPDEKDGVSKISKRVIAAIIVFLVPTLVNVSFELIDSMLNNDADSDYKLSNCYKNATSSCIEKIKKYESCDEYEEKKDCQRYRQCNSYKLNDSCGITTVEDNGFCKNLNEDSQYTIYRK